MMKLHFHTFPEIIAPVVCKHWLLAVLVCCFHPRAAETTTTIKTMKLQLTKDRNNIVTKPPCDEVWYA